MVDSSKPKRLFYKKWCFFIIIGIIVIGAIGGCDSTTTDSGTAGTGQEINQNQKTEEDISVEKIEEDVPVQKTEEDVPTEYKSALIKAKTYSDTMSMSKAGIYDQLISEHGEKFTEEAAQYAIDNVEADWKENALIKAKTYQKSMAMSPSAIYDQLISEHGEKFTEEETQYAIDNLE